MTRWAGIGLVAALLLACESRPHGPAIHVSADRISQEYFENSARADLKYKGKLVEVNGIVRSAGESATLIAGDVFIYANMDNVQEAAKLDKGDAVSLECVGTGEVSGFARLGQCIVD